MPDNEKKKYLKFHKELFRKGLVGMREESDESRGKKPSDSSPGRDKRGRKIYLKKGGRVRDMFTQQYD
jgi:hypothetical protein